MTKDSVPQWKLVDLSVIYSQSGPDVGVVGLIDENGAHVSYLTPTLVVDQLQDLINNTDAPIAGDVVGNVIAASPCRPVAGWIDDHEFDASAVEQFRALLKDCSQ